MNSVQDKFQALRDLGVGEFVHLNGSLESHLMETYEILANWGNPEFVCDAGLYHASYGTQPMKKFGIAHKEYDPADRPKIRSIIGAEAESLVYLYGACDRDFFYPQIGTDEPVYRDRFTNSNAILPEDGMRNLLEITLANELQICGSDPSFLNKNREWYIDLFDRFEPMVSEEAFAQYQETFRI